MEKPSNVIVHGTVFLVFESAVKNTSAVSFGFKLNHWYICVLYWSAFRWISQHWSRDRDDHLKDAQQYNKVNLMVSDSNTNLGIVLQVNKSVFLCPM